MAINFEKDLLKVDQLVGEVVSQHLIEGEIVIPETKPEIAKILDIDARVYETGKEVFQDKVMVEGNICYNLLYIGIGDSGAIAQAEEETVFTQYIDIEGVDPKMLASISFELEHVDYEIQNNKSIIVKTVLNLGCKVEKTMKLEVIKDFGEHADIQALREPVKMLASGGEGKGQTILREDVELSEDMPSVAEILRKDIEVRMLEKESGENRVVAHGEINLRILYETHEAQDPVRIMEHKIPFSHFVEILGAYQGMECDVRVEVQEIDISLRQDIVGEVRVLSVEMMLLMEGKVYEKYEKDLIIDAYYPGAILDLEKEKIILTQIVGSAEVDLNIRESIDISDNMPTAATILYAQAKPLITEYRMSYGQVIVEGVLTGVLLYKPQDEELDLSSIKVNVPFSQALEINNVEGNMDCTCQVSTQYIGYNLVSPNELELKVTLLIEGEVFYLYEKDMLLDIKEIEHEQEGDSGIYIYYIQPKDTLWSIAKRYNTTIDGILRYNNIEDQEALEVGGKIIVFNRLESSMG